MRKLMIAMLALAVVFGFAACDNSTSTSGTGSQLDIAYIVGTEKTAQDYLVGETPDPADFTFTGYDAADNVVIENMSAELFGNAQIDASKEVATFDYAGIGGMIGAMTVEVPVSVYPVESIEVVAGTTAQKTYYTTVTGDLSGKAATEFTTISKTGLTVTATYNDGEGEKVLDADDYVAKLATISGETVTPVSNWSTATAASDYVVQVVFGDASTTADATNSDTFPVEFLTNKITDLYVYVDPTYTLYIDGTTATAAEKLDPTKVVVRANMLNGQVTAPSTGVKYGLENSASTISAGSADGADDLSLLNYSAGSSVNVYAVYSGTDVVQSYDPKTVIGPGTVKIEQDKIVGLDVTITGTPELKLDVDFAKGAKENAAAATDMKGITVKYKMASTATGETLTLNADDKGFTIAGPNGITEFSTDSIYSNGRTVDITITAGDYSAVVRDVKLVTSITQ